MGTQLQNLTLNEMNTAFHAVMKSFSDSLDTTHEGLKLIVRIKSDCNPKDNTGVIFDQETMSIYLMEGCCEHCKCKSGVDKLIPLIENILGKRF